MVVNDNAPTFGGLPSGRGSGGLPPVSKGRAGGKPAGLLYQDYNDRKDLMESQQLRPEPPGRGGSHSLIHYTNLAEGIGPRWRNGRRGGLKIRFPLGSGGSNPFLGTSRKRP